MVGYIFYLFFITWNTFFWNALYKNDVMNAHEPVFVADHKYHKLNFIKMTIQMLHFPLFPFFTPHTGTEKPGQCPVRYEQDPDLCTTPDITCSSDIECTSVQKCCDTECGDRRCQIPSDVEGECKL